jgi:hypothetical protein
MKLSDMVVPSNLSKSLAMRARDAPVHLDA